MKNIDTSYKNNFDLIRLVAAMQVLILHYINLFGYDGGKGSEIVTRIICNFPGVNVFFIISGYLIFQSLDRNSPYVFAKKRFKRIYPALIVCFLFTIVLLISVNSLNFEELFSFDFIKWVLAQLTIFQFYNPDIIRDFGFSPPNGALWTISVELQFYLFIAVLWYFLLKKRSLKAQNIILITIFIFSAIYNNLFNRYLDPNGLAYKLSFVFVLSYLYFFMAGALIYINRDFFIEKFKGKALVWILLFVVVSSLLDYFQIIYHRYLFNGLSFAMLLLLIGLVFSVAYTKPQLSGNILKGNDISYGIYIYQMPILNLFFHLHLNTKFYQLLLSLAICIILGFMSWFLIERRVLKR